MRATRRREERADPRVIESLKSDQRLWWLSVDVETINLDTEPHFAREGRMRHADDQTRALKGYGRDAAWHPRPLRLRPD